MLLFASSDWIVDADLGGVDFDHAPRDRPVKDLPECLGCFETVAG
jgi:hypothetical protein